MQTGNERAPSPKEVRSLANLSDSAATSRVLNLGHVYRTSGHEAEYNSKPFFQNRQMNKAIILKHTVRANERMLFTRARRTVTKIILPFDPSDLKLGGQSIMIGQTGYRTFLRHLYNSDNLSSHTDIEVLEALDELPSLDPFLVREHLARRGHKPAACYLHITPADIARMIGFANTEIESLVATAFGTAVKHGAMKLTGKILSDELDAELDPLRMVLRLSETEFSDGIFSWRGFLYFKWRHLELQDELSAVMDGIMKYRTAFTLDKDIQKYLAELRPRLVKRIFAAISNLTACLSIYDTAYNALVMDRNPVPFRNFLLAGPAHFFELGENLGILSHIGSFWRYRMGQVNRMNAMTAEEFADLLTDFEESLSIVEIPEESQEGLFLNL
ncbi:hypothetical protein [Asticcacaulis solisilvae]|uniref:hypothetical protein n=1 Tax=Asticcacaulis solisilvae TaxID=1217274 RepID=UPI003FD82319